MDHIGQKIKELRKKADLTQDRLAEMLGVSAQAVSKWEVGSASPDLSLIAPLCRVFGVTADELLGIAHEKDPRETEAEEELDRLMKTPGKDGKIDIRSLREKSAEAVKLYPDNLRIAYDYAVSLRFRAADPADGDEEAKRERKRTVEEILKRITRESDDAELKKEAYGTLVLMLAQGGRKKEALALAEEGACKDRLRFMCLEGQEQIAFFQRCVHRDLYELVGFFAVGCAQIRDESFKKGIRDAWEGILRAAVPDGNYGMFSVYFDACLEGRAAQLTKEGRYEEAIACLGEIMEMWERVDEQIANRAADRGTLDPDWGHAYTAPLFEGVEISPVFDRSGNTSYAELFAKTLRMRSDFAPLEGREDYEALVGK